MIETESNALLIEVTSHLSVMLDRYESISDKRPFTVPEAQKFIIDRESVLSMNAVQLIQIIKASLESGEN